ncbi:LytTR family transcriptional regulator DNA-binding domain-containing protein [Saccharopolyspora sp. NPDC049426]|uniref:DNA-binding protein n=1 Tax=Saccharopolyspora sp. NPDC049426 TaxID=3155652 RepID=UPI00343A00DC
MDRSLDVAPGATGENDARLDSRVFFTALGGLGALAGREVERDSGVVTVTDGCGRVLGVWGDPSARRQADLNNLAPRSSWSEQCTGTNGMGTSLEVPGPVTVIGPEHWCESFNQWSCAGISVRDVVTGAPVASINISRLNAPLSQHVSSWLTKAAACVEHGIYQNAIAEAEKVLAEFHRKRAQRTGPLMAMDRGGNVIAANDAAVSMLKLADDNPIASGALEPSDRWNPNIPGLLDVARWAMDRALESAQWSGFASLPACPGEAAIPMTMRPVVESNHVVGVLCALGVQEGEPYRGEPGPPVHSMPPRVIGVRDDRLVLLSPAEIRYAEADRSTVWLSTDRGRIQAATRGVDNVEAALASFGFYRVHRRFLVNLRRVVEVERGIKGELVLITDPRSPELVPVSRRHAPELRRLLGV